MAPFFYVLKVVLNEPILSADPRPKTEEPLVGYYRRIGVAAEDHATAVRLLKEVVTDGEIDWEDSVSLPIEKLDKDIAAHYPKSKGKDCWYMSGRVFFPRAA